MLPSPGSAYNTSRGPVGVRKYVLFDPAGGGGNVGLKGSGLDGIILSKGVLHARDIVSS